MVRLPACALVVVVLLHATPLVAQTDSAAIVDQQAGDGSVVATITLADALERAAAREPRLREALADESVRRAESRVPASRWLPRLGATLQAVLGTNNNSASNWLGSQGAVEMPRIAGTAFLQDPSQVNWTPYLTTAVGIGLDQEVFDFGRIDAAQRAADADLEEALARTEGTRLEVEARAAEAYAGVQAAHEVLRASQAAHARAEELLAATRAWADRGLRAQTDVTRAEAELARMAVAVAHASAGLHVARAQLAAAIGAEELELDAVPPSDTPERLPVLATALAAADAAPALRAAQAHARAAHARADAADTALLPDLRLVATVTGAAGGAPAEGHASPAFGAGGLPWIPNYFAGLVLSWRFFDPERIAARDVARAEEEAARARTDTQRDEARIQIEQAWYAARGAEVSLDALVRARDAAVASYAQVEAQYRAGLASAVEMSDAENLRTSAEVDLAVGRFALDQARADLARRMSLSRTDRRPDE